MGKKRAFFSPPLHTGNCPKMVYELSKMIPNHSSCSLIEDQLLFQLEKFFKKVYFWCLTCYKMTGDCNNISEQSSKPVSTPNNNLHKLLNIQSLKEKKKKKKRSGVFILGEKNVFAV